MTKLKAKAIIKGSVKKGYLPQEIEVWYVLPALRREYAKVFIRKHGLTQKDVAAILQITEAAVSQYISGKRADSVQFSEEIIKMVEESADRVVSMKVPLFKELEKLSKSLTVREVVCDVCKCSNEQLDDCNICFE